MESLETAREENYILEFLRKNRTALYFVVGVSTLSGMANIQYGALAFVTAAIKQCGYSLISTMVLLKIYDYLAEQAKTLPQELIPMFGPACLTTVLNYGMHNLKGTEEALLSSLPTALLAFIGFPIWHIRTRLKELENDIREIDLQNCFDSALNLEKIGN